MLLVSRTNELRSNGLRNEKILLHCDLEVDRLSGHAPHRHSTRKNSPRIVRKSLFVSLKAAAEQLPLEALRGLHPQKAFSHHHLGKKETLLIAIAYRIRHRNHRDTSAVCSRSCDYTFDQPHTRKRSCRIVEQNDLPACSFYPSKSRVPALCPAVSKQVIRRQIVDEFSCALFFSTGHYENDLVDQQSSVKNT